MTDIVADPPRSNANKKSTTATLNFETLLITSPKNAQQHVKDISSFPIFLKPFPHTAKRALKICVIIGKKIRKTFYFSLLVLPIGENLSKSVTVSTKIPPELKEKMKQLKIKPSRLLRKAIEDEIRRKEAEKLTEEIDKLKLTLDRVSVEEIVKSIREDRNSR